MRWMPRLDSLRVLSLLVLLSLSGCVTTPYIELQRHGTVMPPNNVNDQLAHAMAFNERTIAAYEAKVVEDWQRQQNLSNWTIGVATVTVAAALGHAHSDVFKVIAGTSAAAYQFATWNQNPARVGIYLDAIKALMCARSAVQPLVWSQDTRTKIDGERVFYIQANTEAANAMGSTSEALAAPDGTKNLQTLQAEIILLHDEMISAADLYERATGVGATVDGAAASLNKATEEINQLTVLALRSTQSNVIALKDAIKNVSASTLDFHTAILQATSSLSAAFSPTDSATSTITAKKESLGEATDLSTAERNVAQALDKVRKARALLLPARKGLAGSLNPQVKNVNEEMKGCGLEAPKPLLVLDPPSLTLEASQEQLVSQRFTASKLTVSPEQGAVTGLSVTMTPDGRSFSVKTDKTKPGVYVLKASDSDDRLVRLMVTVKGDAQTATNTVIESGRKVCDDLGTLSHTKTCFLQQQLNIDVDGKSGPNTCEAFKRDVAQLASDTANGFDIIAKRTGLRFSSGDDEFRKRLNKPSDEMCFRNNKGTDSAARKTSANTVANKGVELSPDQVRLLAKVLGHPPVTDWRQLSEALSANQNANHCSTTEGKFTEKEIARLLSTEPNKCR